MSDSEPNSITAPERSQARRFVGLLVIAVATAQILGYTFKIPSMLEVNDISRWCTVWSLVERGTYAIDSCPWQHRTQDKVKRLDKLPTLTPETSTLKRVEYALAPSTWKEGPATLRTYSSKPPLLPTLIAGAIYPFRLASGVPLHQVRTEARNPRNVEERVNVWPGVNVTIRRTQPPGKPIEWTVYDYYFKPVLVFVNIIPFVLTLVLFARFLDRHAANDWAWFYCMFAGAWGTLLFAFDQTLNNHTIAATSAFFAMYALVRIFGDGRRHWGYFASAGFFAGFTAANEIPAAIFGIVLFLVLIARFPRQTILFFVPAAALPIAGFFVTQMLAFGQLTPVYEEFGTQSYRYAISYWSTPLEFDYFNEHPEPYGVYLLHMTVGHHGLFSLSPILLIALCGLVPNMIGGRDRLRAAAWIALLMTAAMLAFYCWNPKARNYGGSTQGLRWLFWLVPLWLLMLPRGVEAGQERRWARWVAVAALFASVFSAGYALRFPWSHPWIVDALERLGWYSLKR